MTVGISTGICSVGIGGGGGGELFVSFPSASVGSGDIEESEAAIANPSGGPAVDGAGGGVGAAGVEGSSF